MPSGIINYIIQILQLIQAYAIVKQIASKGKVAITTKPIKATTRQPTVKRLTSKIF